MDHHPFRQAGSSVFFRLPSIILLDERATRLAPVVVWRKVPVFPKDMLPELLAMSNPHPTPRHPAYVRLDTYYSVAIVFAVMNRSKVGYDFLWGTQRGTPSPATGHTIRGTRFATTAVSHLDVQPEVMRRALEGTIRK